MKLLSIVTVALDSAATIGRTVESVASQAYGSIEHIIVDGGSTDDTLEVVRAASGGRCRIVSEPDAGIYDAMNKGFRLAQGEIVAFLNSDDVYADAEVARDVAAAFSDPAVDIVYGDLDMVDRHGALVRRWITGDVGARERVTEQIPHPAMFVRRAALERLPEPFDPSFRIAADLKQQLQLFNVLRVEARYLRRPLARMMVGGRSTAGLASYFAGWRESARAYDDVFGRLGWWYTMRKVASKFKGVRRLA